MTTKAIVVREPSSRRRRAGGRDLLMKADHPDPGRTVQTAAPALTREPLLL
jgi:hypothetical protein